MKKREMRILACFLACQMVVSMPAVTVAAETMPADVVVETSAEQNDTDDTAAEKADSTDTEAAAETPEVVTGLQGQAETVSNSVLSEAVVEDAGEDQAGNTSQVVDVTEQVDPDLDYILGRPMTEEEIAAQKALSPDALPMMQGEIPVESGGTAYSEYSLNKAGNLPVSYNLVEEGAVTSVKNQANSGLCWSFGALAAGESGMLKNGYGEYNLSEAQLGYFTYSSIVPAGCEGDYIEPVGDWYKLGGNDQFTTMVLARQTGAVDQSETGFPMSSTTYPDELAYTKNTAILKNGNWASLSDPSQVKEYILDSGAMTVAMYMNDDYYMKFDTAGYYSNQNMGGTNHIVTIVGWNDNYASANFLTDPGQNGAWLCKNSWGTGWGNGGYFWISYADVNIAGNNTYGYEMIPVEDAYDHTYQYDGGASFGNISYGTSSAYMANVFTAEKEEILRAVSFDTIQTDISYEIQIYKGVDTLPTSGTAAWEQKVTGSLAYAGYHTVEVPEVELGAGEKFAVVIKLQCADGTTAAKIILDKSFQNSGNVWFIGHAASKEGQSYISAYGTNWTDQSAAGNCNVRIKAFTDIAAAKTDITGLEAGTIADVTYDGTAQTPDVVLKNDTYTLVRNEDYTLGYSNNIDAGKATVSVKGIGSYTGTRDFSFTIRQAVITRVDGATGDRSYTGQPLTQELKVFSGETCLTEGTHYTVSYQNNTNPGKATVTVEGTGNYTGTISKEFQILGPDVKDASISGLESKVYTGSDLTQDVQVELDGKTLRPKTDYTVSYENNVNAGTATVMITGCGDFSGSKTATFTITPKKITVLNGVVTKNYYGGAVTQSVSVDGTYSISYKNNTTPGTATVTVTGTGNYTGTLSKEFNINLPARGWKQAGNAWYYASQANSLTRSAWVASSGKWYWMGADGKMAVNTLVSNNNYYVNGSGVMQKGWIRSGNSWYYGNSSGYLLRNQWLKSSGKWYWMGADRKMAVNAFVSSNNYHVNGAGVMQTGWISAGGKWYYANSSGYLQRNKWLKLGATWYYMKADKAMAVGFNKIGSATYYMSGSGAMKTGWQKVGGKWYYMKASGAMATGWQKVGGKWYYMKASGAMAVNTWVGNWYVDGSGAWVRSR